MANDDGTNAFDPEAFLTKAGPGRTISEFRAHEIVYSQGDVGDSVFYLLSGWAKLSYTAGNGKEAVLSILVPGDFFGDRCLIGQPLRTASVSTIADCVIMRVEKSLMLRALREQPTLSEHFIRHLLERHIRVGAHLVDQMISSSEMRLARMLLEQAEAGKTVKPTPVLPKISHETLAEMIGTTRARVSFFMNKFRRQGFVEYNGNLRVNSARWKSIAGGSDAHI